MSEVPREGMPLVDVLMATYRADEGYLRAQRSSIMGQTGVRVNLVEREDVAHEGACANFAALLAASSAPYAAFADQDDVWDIDKLARSMSLMRELEEQYGKDAPLMVFTDARVVDAQLNEISPSLFAHSHIDPDRRTPRQLVMQNVANGCTMLFNAVLREMARPIPENAFMHDHYMMLVASSFGHVACLREPTLSYRQHGANVLGGAKVGAAYFLGLALRGWPALRRRQRANIAQAEAFAQRFGEKAPRELRALKGFARRSWIGRVAILARYRISKQGILRNLGMALVV